MRNPVPNHSSRGNSPSRRPGATLLVAVAGMMLALATPSVHGFDLQFTIQNPGLLPGDSLALLEGALARVETMWETVITGYATDVSIPVIPIEVFPQHATALADAIFTSSIEYGGYAFALTGVININPDQIAVMADWQGSGANGLNMVDEVLAHETGHVLGVGTLWLANQAYADDGNYRYTGPYGVAAYRAEFDAAAEFVPVENAGGLGTVGSHWDQQMRNSLQEGNPDDPWSASPLVGVTDPLGRDRALELMTGAIDPDYGEPFLSRTTVQSMRDLGYTVAEFEDFNGDGAVDAADLGVLTANFLATGLQIDSMAFGDANRDRTVDGQDVLLWQRALHPLGDNATAGVPEPSQVALLLAALFSRRSRRA